MFYIYINININESNKKIYFISMFTNSIMDYFIFLEKIAYFV